MDPDGDGINKLCILQEPKKGCGRTRQDDRTARVSSAADAGKFPGGSGATVEESKNCNCEEEWALTLAPSPLFCFIFPDGDCDRCSSSARYEPSQGECARLDYTRMATRKARHPEEGAPAAGRTAGSGRRSR